MAEARVVALNNVHREGLLDQPTSAHRIALDQERDPQHSGRTRPADAESEAAVYLSRRLEAHASRLNLAGEPFDQPKEEMRPAFQFALAELLTEPPRVGRHRARCVVVL